MADQTCPRADRQFVWTQWEDSGFLERVNHSVTSCNENSRRSMFAIAGFQGRGKPIEGRHGREQWNDLGDTPLDILQLDVGTCLPATHILRFIFM